MTQFKELPGLDISFRPELQSTAQIATPAHGTVSLKLTAMDSPDYIGDSAIEQTYIPSWQATAVQFYRPGQTAVDPDILRPVAESAVFGGAGRVSLANNLPAFMSELEIKDMVLMGTIESDGIRQSQALSLIVATEPSYKGVLAMPSTHLRDKLHQIKTNSYLRWQITLESGSHTEIEVPDFDFSKYAGALIPGFGYMLNDNPEQLFKYTWN